MNKVLVIGGPTGIGKSALAVKLAQRYHSIVIGADSMQIYKGMDIGTGKISEEELCGIKHYMLDIVHPNEAYSVQNYCVDAKRIIDSALEHNILPIVVGGTGLYINSLLYVQNFADAKPNPELREYYYGLYKKYGAKYLHDLLSEADRTAAENIAVNDVKRIIRALEICAETGQNKSMKVSEKKSEYDIKFYIPQTDRNELYERIDLRVDEMMRNGLADEVMGLREYWDCRSLQSAIGYKEIIASIRDDKAPTDAVETIKQNSRRYAKRQLTFFKWIKYDKIYVNKDYFDNIMVTADKWLEEIK